jgi:hypothetical protein
LRGEPDGGDLARRCNCQLHAADRHRYC